MFSRFGNEGCVRVEECGQSKRSRDLVAVLGVDIAVNTKLLTEYCFANTDARTHDLMTIIGAVKWADRSLHRRHSSGWARLIELELPVFDPKTWASSDVVSSLESCLNYVTGDEWHFSFRARRRRVESIGQRAIETTSGRPTIFVPYSHGLDSYAQVRIAEAAEPDSDVVCVFTDAKPSDKTWKEFCRSARPGKIRDIRVPVQVTEPHHAEPSFRTRPFLYYVLAACGALLLGRRVMVPENGQGSLGGSMIPLGGEAKHRSCHPGFTSRLRDFLLRLTGVEIRFEHPALFRSKGQVLAQLARIEADSARWLAEHRSCSHDQRHASVDGSRVHCGVCGNCMLRRMSINAAGIEDVTPYRFSDLSATDLEGATRRTDQIRDLKSFVDLAGNTVRSMQRFANLAKAPDHAIVWTESAELAEAQGRQAIDVKRDLVDLLKAHASEWSGFVARAGQGWLLEAVRSA